MCATLANFSISSGVLLLCMYFYFVACRDSTTASYTVLNYIMYLLHNT